MTEFFSGKCPSQHKHVEHSFFARTYSGVFGPSGARWASWRERRERQRDSETVLRTVDTHRRGMRAGAVVVGTTAGSQRSGTRSTSGIAQCAARAIATTEPVAEAAKNTLGSSCKKKNSSGQRQTQQRQGHGSVVGPRSHQRYTAREDESRHTRNTSGSRKDDRGNGRPRKHDRSTQHSWKKDAETLQRSTTDNRSLALQIESK